MKVVYCTDLEQFAELCAKFTELGLAFQAFAGNLKIEITGY